MSNWETLFFKNSARLDVLQFDQMCNMRTVCSKWNNAIESVDIIYEKIIEANILQRLYYSKRRDGRPSTYGKDYYEKQIIEAKWQPLWTEYKNPLIVNLNYVEDDIFGGDTVVSVGSDRFPPEFSVFLKWYKEYPNTKIKLYRPKVLEKLLKQQIQYTLNRLDVVNEIVHLTPICYSKHYKADTDDKQFINVLCYVNALNVVVLEELGSKYERYHVITLEIEDMQDKKEHYEVLSNTIFDLTDKIESDIEYLEDLDLMTFCQCFDRLLKKQKFNL